MVRLWIHSFSLIKKDKRDTASCNQKQSMCPCSITCCKSHNEMGVEFCDPVIVYRQVGPCLLHTCWNAAMFLSFCIDRIEIKKSTACFQNPRQNYFPPKFCKCLNICFFFWTDVILNILGYLATGIKRRGNGEPHEMASPLKEKKK